MRSEKRGPRQTGQISSQLHLFTVVLGILGWVRNKLFNLRIELTHTSTSPGYINLTANGCLVETGSHKTANIEAMQDPRNY